MMNQSINNKPINFYAPHPKAIAVACRAEYVLAVEFDNGERGVLDMKPYLNFGVFARLADQAKFQTARVVSLGAIKWDADIDIHPAWVYHKCVKSATSIA